MKNQEICRRQAPTTWYPDDLVCILPAGHKIKIKTMGKKHKREIALEGWHETNDGRKWPLGKHNMEFL